MWSFTCTSLVKSRYALRERERANKKYRTAASSGLCSFQFPALIEIKSVYTNLFLTIHLFPTDETEQTSRNSVFLWQMFRQVRFICSTYVLTSKANIHYATNAGMNDLDSFRISLVRRKFHSYSFFWNTILCRPDYRGGVSKVTTVLNSPSIVDLIFIFPHQSLMVPLTLTQQSQSSITIYLDWLMSLILGKKII